MRVTRDTDDKQTEDRNKASINKIKSELVRNIEVLNKAQGILQKQSNILDRGLSIFMDEKGAMLAGSTIALNGVGLALEVGLKVWNEWRDYNKQLEERNETLRRYGVGDMTNYTDLQRSIFTGKISSKRRY